MEDSAALPDGVPLSYSFSMVDMTILDDAISYTIMCRNKRFMIEISAQKLEGVGGLIDTFYEFKENLDDPDIFCDFETWVVDAIDEDIKRLAPAPAPGFRMPTTLLGYYDAETHVFELVNRNGTLGAVEHRYDPKINEDTRPKVLIIEPDSNSVSPGTHTSAVAERSMPTVSRSILPDVPFIPASQLARAAGPESIEEEMCEVPRIVRKLGTDEEFFFKAADNRHGFRREIEILGAIQNIAKHDLSLLTSRIVGLVTWDDDESFLMGMLLELIDGHTLYDAMEGAPIATKKRLMDQVDATVNKLHGHGLVWGDVKPENVMVGPSGDAILMDFGGGCTLQYIEPELQETEEGDLQGLKKLRERFLLGP